MSSIDSIELHVRTYHSALKSSLEVTIHSLTNSYLKINSILHPLAHDATRLDPSAIVYSLLRLPKSIDKSKTVIMAQSPRVFSNFGFTDINQWQKVSSPARRRTSFFNPKTGTFAALISSTTDLDDLVNLLI
ncbi:hypothetical protein KKD37_00735, partial [Patescibacteria group bacterium]|nr:hypothetical protein [Patescibacteria group bacterium]